MSAPIERDIRKALRSARRLHTQLSRLRTYLKSPSAIALFGVLVVVVWRVVEDLQRQLHREIAAASESKTTQQQPITHRSAA